MSSPMELLSSQFNSLLTQYQSTYQEFMNVLDGSSSLITVQNTAYVGGKKLNVLQNSNINSCLSSCESNTSCTGATFSNNKSTCTLSSGMGHISNSTNQSAIVQQALYYSYQLQQINEQLSDINNSMMKLSNSSLDNVNKNQTQASTYATILEQNYNVLESERGEINKMIHEYETLNTAYDSGSIYVSSSYYSYLMYIVIVLVLMGILFKSGLMNMNMNMNMTMNNNMQYGGGRHVSYWLMMFMMVVVLFNSIMKSYI